MPAYKTPTLVDFASVATPSETQQKLQAAFRGAGAYDEAVVGLLAPYLAEQVAGAFVDVDASLALLKLFLVYPATTDAAQVAQVLVKAITALPSPFFTGASTMIPADVCEDANVAAALEAGFLLQSCLFEEFWAKDLSFAKAVPAFEENVRAFILETVSRSHKAVSAAVLQAKLNISSAEVKDVVAAEGWAVEGDVVQITANESNQMRPATVQENIQFEDVLKVIHTLSR